MLGGRELLITAQAAWLANIKPNLGLLRALTVLLENTLIFRVRCHKRNAVNAQLDIPKRMVNVLAVYQVNIKTNTGLIHALHVLLVNFRYS